MQGASIAKHSPKVFEKDSDLVLSFWWEFLKVAGVSRTKSSLSWHFSLLVEAIMKSTKCWPVKIILLLW